MIIYQNIVLPNADLLRFYAKGKIIQVLCQIQSYPGFISNIELFRLCQMQNYSCYMPNTGIVQI
jgi:hypothetical protein